MAKLPLYPIHLQRLGSLTWGGMAISLVQIQVTPLWLLGLYPELGNKCPITPKKPPAIAISMLGVEEAVPVSKHHNEELALGLGLVVR